MVEAIPNPISARRLLAQARTLYDDPKLPFAQAAEQDAWRNGFVSGAAWMRLVLEHLRGESLPTVTADFQRLGMIKYALALLGAIIFAGVALITGLWFLLPVAALVFYGIEAQMVFLFPLALDGQPDVWRESRKWTVQAGGTVRVMLTVMGLAVVMIFGGFFGQGFVRSWALGCLGVVLWYEAVRHHA